MTLAKCDLPAKALKPSASHHARALLACVALALALALTACGGSSKPSASTTLASSGNSAGTAASTAPSSAGTSGSASGSGSGATGSTTGGGFCALVSADEARTVLGVVVKPGVSVKAAAQSAGPAGSCLYLSPDSQSQVNLGVLGNKVPRAVFDQQLKGGAGGDAMLVSGLGETAFSVPGVVFVYDHGLVLSLQILKHAVTIGHAAAVDTAVITDLLRKALSRAGFLR